MVRILSIDPSSNKITTSTTGVVLLDNASVDRYFSVKYGAKNFREWWHSTGKNLKFDYAIVEKYEARDSDYSRDNTVKQTIDEIKDVSQMLLNKEMLDMHKTFRNLF